LVTTAGETGLVDTPPSGHGHRSWAG